MAPTKKRQRAGKTNYKSRKQTGVFKSKRVGQICRKEKEKFKALVDENNNMSNFVDYSKETIHNSIIERNSKSVIETASIEC